VEADRGIAAADRSNEKLADELLAAASPAESPAHCRRPEQFNLEADLSSPPFGQHGEPHRPQAFASRVLQICRADRAFFVEWLMKSSLDDGASARVMGRAAGLPAGFPDP
jgi:hypothetical protein